MAPSTDSRREKERGRDGERKGERWKERDRGRKIEEQERGRERYIERERERVREGGREGGGGHPSSRERRHLLRTAGNCPPSPRTPFSSILSLLAPKPSTLISLLLIPEP
jgi:hypothetical protein